MARMKKSAVPNSGQEAATPGEQRYPGIGRSAITGRFMSVASAKAHKKTAIIEGAGRKRSG